MLLFDARKLVDAALAEEALEALDALFRERLQVVGIVRDDSAPEADVDVPLAFGGVQLDLEVFDGRGRRNRVQGHVDHGREPAGCSGLQKQAISFAVRFDRGYSVLRQAD